jgi:hypothetical protein
VCGEAGVSECVCVCVLSPWRAWQQPWVGCQLCDSMAVFCATLVLRGVGVALPWAGFCLHV